MITESLFKKFVWLDIALWPALFLAFYFQPQTISNLYEVMETVPSFLDTGTGLAIGVINLILFFVSYFFLLKFMKLGKILYPLAFVTGLFLDYHSGIIISSNFLVILDTITSMLSGVIILLLFTSPIKDKFR